MEESLYYLINNSKRGDKDSMMEIIIKFNPLIKKYKYLLQYDGAESDLIIELIKIIRKIPIDKDLNFRLDKYLVAYISYSIKNKYIFLSKKYNSIYSHETELNLDISEATTNLNLEDRLFILDILDKLSNAQRNVLILSFIKDYSDSQISKILNISRQAVNRTKNRAINNIRKYIKCSDFEFKGGV